MRFLIDIHHVGGRATGNETWARETTRAMLHLGTLASGSSLHFAVAHAAGAALVDGHAWDMVSGDSVRRLAWDLPRLTRANHSDAILVQYTRPLSPLPAVVAVHDLSFTHPESRDWLHPRQRARMQATIGWSARSARRVVTLSEFTAHDLETQWRIPRDRIVVAPPAVSSSLVGRFADSAPRTRQDGDPAVVLAVGNVLPRKNLAVVAKAVSNMRHRGLAVNLRVVGQVPSGGVPVFAELQAICGDWLTVTGYVDEATLCDEYGRASVLCFPSLFEGFGLPVLEAMYACVPVVASRRAALPEAVGDAGILVEPDDVLAWEQAIERIVTDDECAGALRAAGRAHAAAFDWADTGLALLAALREAAE